MLQKNKNRIFGR